MTAVQEEKLVDWCCFLGTTGHPVNTVTIGFMVQDLLGQDHPLPSSKWIRRFRGRHKAVLRFSKLVGLDPKRVQCFNKFLTYTNLDKSVVCHCLEGVRCESIGR